MSDVEKKYNSLKVLISKKELVQTYQNNGNENLICVVAVSSVGEVSVITVINYEKANYYYLEDYSDFIDDDFSEDPGVYLVEFRIEGDCDYWGEYDSWSEFDNVVKYKIAVEDKRGHLFEKDAYSYNFMTKIYCEDSGSEYPRCLFMVDDSGKGIILDILNEKKAYKSIIREMVHYMDDLDTKDSCIKAMGLYEANFSIVGDMENLLDRDDNEDVKLTNIKKIKLLLENNTFEESKTLKKKDKELENFCKYVDCLRMKDEHIC